MHNRARRTISLRATQPIMDIIEEQHSKKNCNLKTIILRIKDINPISLRVALIDTVIRHEILCAFKMPSNPAFEIHSVEHIVKKLPYKYIDASDKSLSFPTSEVASLLKALGDDFFTEPLNYHEGPLWKSRLIKLNANESLFIMLFNNIIVDERTITVLLRDISAFYNHHEFNEKIDLPYIPSLSNINLMIPDETKKMRVQFWKAELENLNPIQIHPDKAGQHKFPFPGKRIVNKLPTIYLEKIKAVYGNYSAEHIYLSVIFIVLHLLTHEDDICIGITAPNRKHHSVPEDQMDNLVNAFFQCAPLRINLSSTLSFQDVITRIANKHKKILENLLPINIIQSEAMPKDRKNLFFANPYNIIVAVNPPPATLNLYNTHSEPAVEAHNGWSKMEQFGINIRGDEITIEFNSSKFIDYTMELLQERIIQTLELASLFPHQQIGDYNLLLPTELELIKKYNDTTRPYQTNLYAHEYLYQIALKTPESLAVVSHGKGKNEKITYGELDRLSSLLASNLKISPGDRVGITLTRSINFYIAMFAVMKAGGVFVNLEITDKSLNQKLSLANIKFIIAQDEQQTKLSAFQCLFLDADHTKLANRLQMNNSFIFAEINPNSPAYIMFTSGTSGKTVQPKGVLCTHGGLRNLHNHMLYERSRDPHHILAIANMISSSPFGFDACLFDLLQALANSAVIHLTPNEHRIDAMVISKLICNEKIEYAVFPAPILAELNMPLPSLKYVISMGAKPNPKLIETLRKLNPTLEINNGYGPTETTIAITNAKLDLDSSLNDIGSPFINSKVSILNPTNHQICPLNIIGEIYISGASVSEGYLDPAQNMHRFIWMRPNTQYSFEICNQNDPYAQKFYATGDLACYKMTRKGLTVEFIGRSNRDREVKLSGALKMDLDAVESVIRNSNVAKDVHLSFNEQTGITAYVVPYIKQLTTRQIRTDIRRAFRDSALPYNACPKAIMKITHIPKTNNGKVDTQQITHHIVHDIQKFTDRSEIQQKLINIIATKIAPENQEFYADTIETELTFDELGVDSIDLLSLKRKILQEFFTIDEAEKVTIDENSSIEIIEKEIKHCLNTRKFLNITGYEYYAGAAFTYLPPTKKTDNPSPPNSERSRNLQH